jgi:hypothetical protein
MKTKFCFALVLIVAILLVIINAQSSSQSLTRYYIVKLYSGEKVIGTWQSRDIGKVEGESLTFVVKGDFDINARTVRIQGVYTVEEIQGF